MQSLESILSINLLYTNQNTQHKPHPSPFVRSILRLNVHHRSRSLLTKKCNMTSTLTSHLISFLIKIQPFMCYPYIKSQPFDLILDSILAINFFHVPQISGPLEYLTIGPLGYQTPGPLTMHFHSSDILYTGTHVF
jgi:hypothetical protein